MAAILFEAGPLFLIDFLGVSFLDTLIYYAITQKQSYQSRFENSER